MNSKENQVFNLLLIEYIFSKKSTKPEACNFIKKETLAQVFSCEFCEISKNTFFTEHLWTTASAGQKRKASFSQEARKKHKGTPYYPTQESKLLTQHLILSKCPDFVLSKRLEFPGKNTPQNSFFTEQLLVASVKLQLFFKKGKKKQKEFFIPPLFLICL